MTWSCFCSSQDSIVMFVCVVMNSHSCTMFFILLFSWILLNPWLYPQGFPFKVTQVSQHLEIEEKSCVFFLNSHCIECHILYISCICFFQHFMGTVWCLHWVYTMLVPGDIQYTVCWKYGKKYGKFGELLEFKIKLLVWTMLFRLYRSGFWLWGPLNQSCSIHSVGIQVQNQASVYSVFHELV